MPSAVLRRLLHEPMLHFLLLALGIFALYGLTRQPEATVQDRITVSAGRIDQIATIFAATWQRPPSPEELKGLIDDYVQEEILVREALALELDRDDPVIRRRLRQKMAFLIEADADFVPPTDADLQAYLTAHREVFATAPVIGFRQVFLNPALRGDRLDADVASLLAAIKAAPDADPATLGDATLLPIVMAPATATEIAQTFGQEFAAALISLDLGGWTGPVASQFGLHLVQVTDRRPGRDPALSAVRDAVQREWTNARELALFRGRMEALRDRYDITVETAPPAGPAQ